MKYYWHSSISLQVDRVVPWVLKTSFYLYICISDIVASALICHWLSIFGIQKMTEFDADWRKLLWLLDQTRKSVLMAFFVWFYCLCAILKIKCDAKMNTLDLYWNYQNSDLQWSQRKLNLWKFNWRFIKTKLMGYSSKTKISI